MTEQQWERIKEICRSALEREASEREPFLEAACAGDAELRQGVEALMAEQLQRVASSDEQETTLEDDHPTIRNTTTQVIESEPPPSDRWRRLLSIVEAAKELSASERAAFLHQVCEGDEELRQEVQSLLAYRTGASQATSGAAQSPAPAPPRRHATPSPSAMKTQALFLPGAMLADRYRVIGLLAAGGMGEVYRADDVKLGQSVALKFLTGKLANNAGMLARFHNEVRVARQITHPNVCRIYDIGEVMTGWGVQHFISMEFIDGEDLGSLLRRIGRVPAEKASEMARQICSGLAAIHENNVLHRDLKPANVMIDGRGRARITDFGIAALSDDLHNSSEIAGTPAYMAPEQITGKGVTIKSDLYSLGLVLYELFTGKRAFAADTIPDLIKQHQFATPTSISDYIKEVDASAERVIMRCLEKDPAKRPESATQVGAVFSGGDPLAAALAAGETPSPEMVAAAPKEGTLKPAVASACLAGVVLVLAFLLFFAPRVMLFNQVPLDKSPEVMDERAHNLLARLGYPDAGLHTASGYELDTAYLEHPLSQEASRTGWQRFGKGQPLTFYFWHRQSPRYMQPFGFNIPLVTVDDPPMSIAGMTALKLDPRGRLVEFQAVPPQLAPTTAAATVPDWSVLFAEAGLSFADFQPSPSQWVPPTAYDQRAAWEGAMADNPDIAIRVEAASFGSTPVYFQIVAPWTKPLRQEEVSLSGKAWTGIFLLGVVIAAILTGMLFLAYRNLRAGRGDRSGAFKVAVASFAAVGAGAFLLADHMAVLSQELYISYRAVQTAMMYAALTWLAYIALEPYVRRYWPHLIVSWSRLLAGDFRNPMVGRDILVGGLLGLFHTVGIYFGTLLSQWLGAPINPNASGRVFSSTRKLVGSLLYDNLGGSFTSAFLVLTFLLLLYILCRRKGLAVAILWILYVSLAGLLFLNWWPQYSTSIIIATSIAITASRFGLLALTVWQLFFTLSFHHPITTSFSVWHGSSTLLTLVFMMGLALYGFFTALGGEPAFKMKLPES